MRPSPTGPRQARCLRIEGEPRGANRRDWPVKADIIGPSGAGKGVETEEKVVLRPVRSMIVPCLVSLFPY